MSGSPQRYAEGDHLRLTEPDGTTALWTVVRRAGRGWRVEPVGGGDTRTMPDAEITAMRLQSRLEHYGRGRAGLKPAQAELLERAFESNKPEHCTEAMRRAAYVTRVHELRKAGVVFEAAFAQASTEIFAENGAAWDKEDEAAEEEREKERARRRRLPVEQLKNPPRERKPLAAPQPSTVESWYFPWVAVNRDIRILIPLKAQRGNRTPRFTGKSACIYDKMKEYVEDHFLKEEAGPLSEVHKLLNKELEEIGLKVSRKCFTKFLHENYSDYDEIKARFNWRKAHLACDVFQRRRPPAKPLDEIEIDHSLLDIIVVNEKSGRRLGRPWITLAIDRCTRMVLGVHVSFEVPSYASLQRCLAHSFWPKDLRGLNLRNPWPTEGVPRLVFCDNGKEFHCKSLKLSELAMGFTIAHCPPRQPWLKGKVERIFGRIGVQVFSLEEGKTFSNAAKRGEYKSIKKAKMTLPELKAKILNYLVDDYHVTYHQGLKGIPLEEWQRHAEIHRVDGVRSYSDIRRLTGAVFNKPISNVGIKIFGLVFFHNDLKELRRRRGGAQKRWEIRADPFNLGDVELLDDETGRWITLPCDRPEISVGISLHQARTNERRARRVADGAEVTDEHRIEGQRLEMAEAAEALGDERAKTTAGGAARYALPNGEFFTPLLGQPEAANDPGPPLAGDVTAEAPADEPASGQGTADGAADPDVQAAMLEMMAQWTKKSA